MNGAGKTTTIRMLLGMIRPLAGTIHVCGERIVPGGRGPWDKVGYLVESPFSYPELTVEENLRVVARLRHLDIHKPVEKIIEAMHLDDYAGIKARNLSLGNNQRLGLAKALIHEPRVLMLDEPSNGLDPSGIVEIRELLRNYAINKGRTVFISSHNLAEISRIATRIGIIHRGCLLQELDAGALGTQLRRTLVLDVRDRAKAIALLANEGYAPEQADGGMIHIAVSRACENPDLVNAELVREGFPPTQLGVVEEDLETYFLRIIGERT